MTDTFTISALSRLFGHDRRKVTRLLQGVEPMHEDGRSRRYTVRQYADALLADLVTEEGQLLDPGQERAQLDRVRRALAKQELKRRAGELLEWRQVYDDTATLIVAMRSRLLALPSGIAPHLAGETDPRKIEALITERVHEALEELSRADEWWPKEIPEAANA